jgi:hypothetical protein
MSDGQAREHLSHFGESSGYDPLCLLKLMQSQAMPLTETLSATRPHYMQTAHIERRS